jgi:hypothetical protein
VDFKQWTDSIPLTDTIPGAVPVQQPEARGIAAIPAKDRRLVPVVGEYVNLKHLVDTQAAIIKCAQEYQHKYLTTVVRVEFEKLRLLQLELQPYKAA